ncbi:pectinesterase family protein [Actinoplanes awajinensis]|uniref:Pectinesterase n=1 Tax=Actinoplanes awajinensis subsp. mycoplanecinus TaxID=135947 RepID=A0A101JMT7_9ACTN|nr:pectinesterase family protein [Actinoplanes awajinensis]KUL29701.1 pectin esterase [Actinoplanes awajinensis subsp. mycoplanecinus]
MRRTAALALLIAATVVGISSPASAVPSTGVAYQLKVTKSGMCLDVPGASTANAALLQQWGCTAGSTWQQFTLVASGSNYLIKNVNSGKCVDVPGFSTVSGVQVQQYTCVGSQTNQQWKLTASGSGTYQVININSGLCLSDKDASTASGAAIIQETCTANTNKQWAFAGASTAGATVAKDGSGQYTTVQAAIDAVPANNTTRRTITIAPGTYREIVTIPSNKPYVTLQGLGSAASQTIIVNNHSSAGGYGTSGSATVFVNGADFAATNLTLSNDYGEGSQAVAANLNGDRSVFDNVRFLGAQDTLLVNNYRAYVKNSYVEGTVDFIFGGGTAVFTATAIYEKRSTGGPITAAKTDAANPYGFLFYKCTITGATNNTTQLGRPWGADAQVLYRESSLSATIATAQPWTDMSSNSWKNARFLEYKNTGSGATTNSNRPQLADAQAANYTPQKYLAGSDNWNPVG